MSTRNHTDDELTTIALLRAIESGDKAALWPLVPTLEDRTAVLAILADWYLRAIRSQAKVAGIPVEKVLESWHAEFVQNTFGPDNPS